MTIDMIIIMVLMFGIWYILGFWLWQWVLVLRGEEAIEMDAPVKSKDFYMGFFGLINVILVMTELFVKYIDKD